MRSGVYGLLGRKLGHSYSAAIHAKLGLEGYKLIEKEPEQLEAYLKSGSFAGLNVTIPYKIEVMKYCSCLSPEAAEIGSVNTITVQEDGTLAGYNTDAYGFEYMTKRAGIDFAGKKTIVLGSGGASKTVCAMAKKLGAASVTVISRGGQDNYERISRHSDAGIVVNATPVGMYPNTEQTPVDLVLFKNCSGAVDLIYNPARTGFIMKAQELGIPCTGGLPMLAAQAKAAEELFFASSIDDGEISKIVKQIRTETENIVLVGMPGSGKSSIGKSLGELTGRTVVDTDEMVVKAAGRTIPEIFSELGEEAFRAMEREQTALAGSMSGCIIVTGGGCVKDERNYAPLHRNGRIYMIQRELALLETAGRPLSEKGGLDRMYEQRLPMYMRFSDCRVQNDVSPQKTAQSVWRDFCENIGD